MQKLQGQRSIFRSTQQGRVLRVITYPHEQRGIFHLFLSIKIRFGERAPSVESVVENLAKTTGEIISASGAVAANMLGLSTQNPARHVYWTSGRSRHLTLGAQSVGLLHVPNWQLRAPQSRAGHAFRALAWYGKSEAKHTLQRIISQLSEKDRSELFSLRASAPTWLAQELSVLAAV